MTLDLPAIRARAAEMAVNVEPVLRMERNAEGLYVPRMKYEQTVADRDALLAEVERLSRNLELASAECCDLSVYRQLVREEHPAEVAALTAEVERLRERVRRVALWVVDEIEPDMNEDDKQQLANEALEATRG